MRSMSSELPRLKRCLGKSVTMRHLSSPRMPWGASTCATTSRSSDDVEVDAGALAGGGGFDEGAEAADDPALSTDDFADVLFVDFELVDGGVAILDFVDFDVVWFIDEGFGNVLDQSLQVRLELFEVVIVLEFFFVVLSGDGVDGGFFGHKRVRPYALLALLALLAASPELWAGASM